MDETAKKRMGRPPSGLGEHGEPEKISDYPKLAVTIRPSTRAKLNAAALLESRPAWQVVDDSINQYVERMPAIDRHRVEAVARKSLSKLSG
jgi:hypothetical protein